MPHSSFPKNNSNPEPIVCFSFARRAMYVSLLNMLCEFLNWLKDKKRSIEKEAFHEKVKKKESNVLYVRIDAVLIPFEQNVEGLIIAVSIQSHQDVVCKNF